MIEMQAFQRFQDGVAPSGRCAWMARRKWPYALCFSHTPPLISWPPPQLLFLLQQSVTYNTFDKSRDLPVLCSQPASAVVQFFPLWPGHLVSMADTAAGAARKVCHSCGVEKNIDQFQSFRGPRRVVFNCADCRKRGKDQVYIPI
jgi:hypothetical protein